MNTGCDRSRARAGFTLIELMVGATLLLVLLGGLTLALSSISRGSTSASIDAELQSQAERALRSIVASLKPSGFTTVGGVGYPYLFQDGAADDEHEGCAHAPCTHDAHAGEADFGPNREIAFVEPADTDGDNRPDLDAAGQMIWSANQHSFVVVTRADGRNVLEHRTDGGPTRVIANHVERICFDDNTSSGFVVPLRAIRIRIWLRQADDKGAIHHYSTETVVKLRNG